MSTVFRPGVGGPSADVTRLTGNVGGAVPPTANNINIYGDGTLITTTGVPATSTITASIVDGNNGQLIIGGGGAGADWADLTSSDNSITITTGVNSIDLVTAAASTVPAFSAFHTVAQNNITGDGTVATINFTTVIFNDGGGYDGLNTFTAPTTGRYLLQFTCTVTATRFLRLNIVTTNRNYCGFWDHSSNLTFSNPYLTYNMSCIADMTAGHTAYCTLTCSDGSKDEDVPASSDTYGVYFQGHLIR